MKSKEKFSETIVKKFRERDRKQINLRIPVMCASNGRIILQTESRPKFITELNSGIIIPSAYAPQSQDNKDTKNPDADKDFYVVAFAPEVSEQLRIHRQNEDGTADKLEIQIGDRAILSEYFEAIIYNEGTKEDYRLVHWQDILGILKDNS